MQSEINKCSTMTMKKELSKKRGTIFPTSGKWLEIGNSTLFVSFSQRTVSKELKTIKRQPIILSLFV